MHWSPTPILLLMGMQLLLPAAVSSMYCVVRLNKGTVEGPFRRIADARTTLNQQPGGPSNRQMICERALGPYRTYHLWTRPDPEDITFGGQQQGGLKAAGFETWWYGPKDILRMNIMCEADCNWDVKNWQCPGKIEYRANYKGHRLTSIAASSPGECCAACAFHASCNTWVYCGAEHGCGDNGVSKGTCDLKRQYGPNYLKWPAKWASGDFVPWVSGVLPEGSITSKPEDTDSDPTSWYCVARLNQNIVEGPYNTASQAMDVLRRQKGYPSDPQMICEMSSCGPSRDPIGLNRDVAAAQVRLIRHDYEPWWGDDAATINSMNDMCAAKCLSPPEEKTPGWFCVANTTGVKGPYKHLWQAKAEHSKQLQSVPANVCAMSPGMGADPNPIAGLGMPNNWQSGATWGAWREMAEMRSLCDQDPFCAGTAPTEWWCVANINRDTVRGPFMRLEHAKTELNKLVGSPSNRQMICVMGADGTAQPDPRKLDYEISQDKGNSYGLSSWWYGWNDIKKMNAMCESRCGPTNFYYDSLFA